MDKEYNIMTDATQDALEKLVEGRGYKKVEVESWDTPLFRNNSMIGVRVEKVDLDEIEYDMYQAKRRDKEGFIAEPRTYLRSDIGESFMGMDEELLIETGQIEEMPDRKQVESQMRTDFEELKDRLRTDGYKVDFYITTDGWEASKTS